MRVVLEPEQKKSKKIIHGGRNLGIVGVVSTVLAGMTTGVSLAIYHNSGDIYLDRSRPGYLPDEEEIENEEENEVEEYSFEKSGKLTAEILAEYLERLQAEIKAIDAYEQPFDESALSDERLGIPVVEPDSPEE
ncbi:MAG: hypothetical protein Q4C24_01765 [Candidatus Saccharibacteria bacterium]|nr:hypothetical protein [Candidatus Saccharibacteria bacterium]